MRLTNSMKLAASAEPGPGRAAGSWLASRSFSRAASLFQSESEGGYVVLTAPLLASPALAALTAVLRRKYFETAVKGLSAPVRLSRLGPRSSLDAGLGGK